ncbi:MAG: hypothetical protein LBC83_04725 [Oscillospiraceae bacterium]|jgi:hypothetical protein|nr:hypothetical protein [Oscillospiraceae bacterium]
MKKTYFTLVHRWGRAWCLASLLFMLCIPLSVSVYFNAWPPLQGLMKGLLAVIPLYWATAVIEVVSYAPLMGSGACYLSFVTGNISNLKLPCAIAALKSAGVRPNSEEGEVVSTIAVATSAITTTVLIAAGVLLLAPLLPYIANEGSPVAPAFRQVLPALFGALLGGYLKKQWRISFVPILAGVAVLLLAPAVQAGILIPLTVIASLAGAQLFYKMKWVK